MVNTALVFGPESKPPLFATASAADEFITVRRAAVTTFLRIGGLLRQIVVLEQTCL